MKTSKQAGLHVGLFSDKRCKRSPGEHRRSRVNLGSRVIIGLITGLFKTNQMAMLIVTIAMTAWTTADDDDDHGGNGQ